MTTLQSDPSQAVSQGIARICETSAKDVMTGPVKTISYDAALDDAVNVLLAAGIHGAPVVDDAGVPVGMFSFIDVIRGRRVEGDREDSTMVPPSEIPGRTKRALGNVAWVKDVMQPDVITVSEEASLLDVIHTMLDYRIHRVLVRERKSGTLAGVITYSDVMRKVLKSVLE